MEFWKNIALSSSPVFLGIQFGFLLVTAGIRMRQLINTRIGGIEAVEVKSWPRLVSGVLACNGAFLLVHHLYLNYGPDPTSRIAFFLLFFLLFMVSSVLISGLGVVFDHGEAIGVLTDRFKPEHDARLVDMTQDGGKVAQLIPRGAIFAYQWLMFYTLVVVYMK